MSRVPLIINFAMLFEVPYNFDVKLIPFYKKYASHINYIYLPPYKDDSDNTRTSIQTNTIGHCYMPQSRAEYEHHLRLITEAGLRFVVLWQLRNNILSTETLNYYSNLGTSGFIVANDVNARIIRDFNPNLLVICSIVRRLCANITNMDFKDYDYIILYYTFNRSLDVLKKLNNIKDKIILMPNTLCNIDCPSVHHWFPPKERPFDAKIDCCMNIMNVSKCGMIFPEHLYLFDKYVGGYKLQGREYSTPAIKYICHFYFSRTYYSDFIDPFFNKEMSHKIQELLHSMPPEEYYNIKTPDIIDII